MPATPSPSAPLKGLPPLPKTGRNPRPKPLRKPSARPTGPRLYRLETKPQRSGVGPGEPPTGFLATDLHGSRTEWWVYWALAKVLHDPPDPRQPPFVGGSTWGYQKATSPFTRSVGSQVLDFVVFTGRKTIGIRVDTERYHIFTTATQQAKDFYLTTNERAVDQIVSIYDQDFLGDPTGRAVCAAVADAIKGIQRYSPIRTGTARRVRT